MYGILGMPMEPELAEAILGLFGDPDGELAGQTELGTAVPIERARGRAEDVKQSESRFMWGTFDAPPMDEALGLAMLGIGEEPVEEVLAAA